MSYYVITTDELNDNPDADWYLADSWCNDGDDAARDFMEREWDPLETFGTNASSASIIVFVYDTETKETETRTVSSNPRPGYRTEDITGEVDELEVLDQLNIQNRPTPNDV